MRSRATYEVLLDSISTEETRREAAESLSIREYWLVFYGGEHCSDWRDKILDRLRLVAKMVVTCVSVVFLRREPAADVVAIDVGSVSPGRHSVYSGFLQRAFSANAEIVHWGSRPSRPQNLRQGHRMLRTAFWGTRLAWSALRDRSPRRLRWLVRSVRLILCVQARTLDAESTVYVSGFFDPPVYVAAAYLESQTAHRVVLVAEGTPLFNNLRHTHLQSPLALNSAVQIPEYAYFHECGWIRCRTATYVGPISAITSATQSQAIDVGFFSSGTWARDNGLTRTIDVPALVRSGEIPSALYDKERELILATARYCRKHELVFRVYAHPWERELFATHGLKPPYVADVQDGISQVDIGPGDSRGRILESAIAVTLHSTLIWDRVDAGNLASLCYHWDEAQQEMAKTNTVFAPSIGPYQSCLFRSAEELAARLDALRAPNASQMPGSD